MFDTNSTIDAIVHPGEVVSVDAASRIVSVRFDNEGECGSCPAARLCGPAKGNSNIINICSPEYNSYRPGDKVMIYGTERMHRKAIFLATVFPCIAMIAIMTIVFILTFDQLIAAISGIAVMLVFFFLLYIFRNKIRHEFNFTIKKLSSNL